MLQNFLESPLVVLDTTIPGFCTDLEALDCISSRTCDTVHVFYVRAGQKNVEEILQNVVSKIQVGFYNIINAEDWPLIFSTDLTFK